MSNVLPTQTTPAVARNHDGCRDDPSVVSVLSYSQKTRGLNPAVNEIVAAEDSMLRSCPSRSLERVVSHCGGDVHSRNEQNPLDSFVVFGDLVEHHHMPATDLQATPPPASTSTAGTAEQDIRRLTPRRANSDAAPESKPTTPFNESKISTRLEVSDQASVVSFEAERVPAALLSRDSLTSRQRKASGAIITSPKTCDVLCGKGSKTLHHNRHFTALCAQYAELYSNTRKRGKNGKKGLAMKIVNEIRRQEGRFLKATGPGSYQELTDEQACEKIGHAIRDLVRRR